MPRGRVGSTTEQLFSRHVQYEPNTGCWLWQGQVAGMGYGMIKQPSGRKLPAHRISYERHNGSIPSGMFICHRCDVPACVNPDHLFLGSPRDNAVDMVVKGRNRPAAGKDSHFAKIGPDDALEIARRLALGQLPCRIADDMGVSRITVSQIKCGKSWRRVTGIERAAPVRSRPDKSKTPLKSRGFPKTRPFPGETL